jgi:hypothetical protein
VESGIDVVENAPIGLPRLAGWLDRNPRDSSPAILLVPPLASIAREAIRLVAAWPTPIAVIDHDDLDLLPVAVNAVSHGVAVASPTLLERNHRLPEISARHADVLRALGDGLSGTALNSRLALSESTTKRELAHLRALVGVKRTSDLRDFARRNGYTHSLLTTGSEFDPNWT